MFEENEIYIYHKKNYIYYLELSIDCFINLEKLTPSK